jgi:CheY-like chemotaxis protein
MIIDDDADDIEMFIEAVAEIDPTITCHQAKNGIIGITLLNNIDRKPDYIFVDMNMPKMNGKQFIDEARNNKLLGTGKIILYSTSRPDSNAMHGADGFISKPTTQEELCLEISKIIGEDIKISCNGFK